MYVYCKSKTLKQKYCIQSHISYILKNCSRVWHTTSITKIGRGIAKLRSSARTWWPFTQCLIIMTWEGLENLTQKLMLQVLLLVIKFCICCEHTSYSLRADTSMWYWHSLLLNDELCL